MSKTALSYLKSEIRASILKDVIDVAVYHARRQRVKDGGHFSIPRLVFCYVDHLGHIAYGGNSTARTVRFIKEFFPERYRVLQNWHTPCGATGQFISISPFATALPSLAVPRR